MSRKAQGLAVGRPPYGAMPGEDVGAVVAAFERTGSYHDAARELNAAGILPRSGKQWFGTSVRRVVLRASGPQLTSRPRIRSRGTHTLTGLLTCHCGGPVTVTRQAGRVLCSCGRGIDDPGHSRPVYVSEAKLLPWVRAEAARLRLPEAAELELAADDARRVALERKRERIIDSYTDGAIERPARDRRLAEVDAERDALAVRAVVVAVPALDWSWSPATLNGVLRSLFRTIQLGADLLPVRAEWLVPEWRAE